MMVNRKKKILNFIMAFFLLLGVIIPIMPINAAPKTPGNEKDSLIEVDNSEVIKLEIFTSNPSESQVLLMNPSQEFELDLLKSPEKENSSIITKPLDTEDSGLEGIAVYIVNPEDGNWNISTFAPESDKCSVIQAEVEDDYVVYPTASLSRIIDEAIIEINMDSIDTTKLYSPEKSFNGLKEPKVKPEKKEPTLTEKIVTLINTFYPIIFLVFLIICFFIFIRKTNNKKRMEKAKEAQKKALQEKHEYFAQMDIDNAKTYYENLQNEYEDDPEDIEEDWDIEPIILDVDDSSNLYSDNKGIDDTIFNNIKDPFSGLSE